MQHRLVELDSSVGSQEVNDIPVDWLREISLTTGAGGLLNWANFPASFH